MTTPKDMTPEELRDAARRYDNLQNEGGEGYNPYRAEAERRAIAAAQAKPKTKQDLIDDLHHRIEVECGSVAREWGDIEAIDALQADLYAQIDALKAEIEAEFLAMWPKSETIARRSAWNGMVQAGQFGEIGGSRADHAALETQEEKQGWTMADLKRAVRLHGLK